MRKFFTAIFLLFTAWLLQSCQLTRHLEHGQHLVVKTQIHLNGNNEFEYKADPYSLETALKQKSYRKILGFIPFHLTVWNFAAKRNQDKKLNAYLTNTVGEAPPIYEPILLEKSKDQLLRTLKNEGYFDATVNGFAFLDKKTTELHFYINSGPAYTIRKVQYAFEDTALIKEFKNENGVKTTLTPGDRFNADQFEKERNRLTDKMKNLGYFTFDKIHVLYDIDTNMPGTRFDVSVRLRNLRLSETINGQDSIMEKSHRKHFLNTIVINEDFNARAKTRAPLDTILFRNLSILSIGKPFIRPLRISRNIFISPGDQYSLSRTNYSYERLNSLNNFRFIDMQYSQSNIDTSAALLDLRINLTRAPKHSFSLETTGTNRSGNLGISTSVNYKNRNLFRGAEQLDWKIYGGLESQRTNSTNSDANSEVISNISIFNTYEFGSQVSLTIPDFLMRISKREFLWLKEPKTNISASVDRQVRPQYKRNLLNTTYQYTMRLRDRDQLIIAPVDLSVIQLDNEPEFEQQLQETGNSLLINSYNDHIIAAGRISYSYTTQDINKFKNYYYYKLNFESAGNLLRAVSGSIGLPYDESTNSYLIDSIAFAQYIKFDVNFVKNVNLTENSKMVYRFFGGIGTPFSNLNTLPFERSFFAGGSNGIRAWRARALGPGSLSEIETYGIDQVGEFQLELNLEYRFHIIKQVEGALFTDMGNIWLLNLDPQREGAEFKFDRFYNEIALAPGAGIRLNFSFFILRLDGGLQIKNPALPEGERWLFQPKTLTNQLRSSANDKRQSQGFTRVAEWDAPYRPQITFNLAIQYPF